VAVSSLGFLMVQSVKAVFLREAGTAGTSAPTTCGANISCVGRIEQVPPSGELGGLKKEIRRLEEKIKFPVVCVSCGKPLLPEFKICPYCGESLKSIQEKMLEVEDYR